MTEEMILEKNWQDRYVRLRFALWVVFLLACLYFAKISLFPIQTFSFSQTGKAPGGGSIKNIRTDDGTLSFDASSRGDFSMVQVSITATDQGADFSQKKLSLRKTYKAFSFPLSNEPFDPANFSIPNEGFAEGTLVAHDIAVYVIVDGQARPFNNPLTFLSFGYRWEDVVPASDEAFSRYARGSIFAIDQSHSDGTLFKDLKTGEISVVRSGSRPLINSEEQAKFFPGRRPIEASSESLFISDECVLSRGMIARRTFYCSLPIERTKDFSGNTFLFGLDGTGDVRVENIKLRFFNTLNWNNLRDTLSTLKNKFLANYGYADLR